MGPLSHSQAETLKTCGRKWELSYVDLLEKKNRSTRASDLGNVFHYGMEVLIKGIYTLMQSDSYSGGIPHHLMAAVNRETTNMAMPLIDAGSFDMGDLADIHVALKWYPSQVGIGRNLFPIEVEGKAAVELKFEVDGWRGKIDAIMKNTDNDQIEMFDWKYTGDIRQPERSVNSQVPTYAHLVERQYGVRADVAYAVLFSRNVPHEFLMNKNGTVSQNKNSLKRCVPEIWRASAPEGINVKNYEYLTEYMGTWDKFISTIPYFLNEHSERAVLENMSTTEALRDWYVQRLDNDQPIPANLAGGCQWCEFLRVCETYNRGGNVQAVIDEEYQLKRRAEEEEADD